MILAVCGSLVSRSYPGVQTQSAKDLYCYTDHPMPDDWPEWPTGPLVHAYLHSYAEKHKLGPMFRLNTNVERMERCAKGGWTLSLETKGTRWSEYVDFVAVSTGQFSDKNIIKHAGRDGFVQSGGTVLHSSEYTDTAVLADKRVVVLGGSKSATDIAVSAVKAGASEVVWVYQKPMWRVPYYIGGLINFKHVLYMRAQELQFNAWGRTGLQKILEGLFRPLVWANFRALEMLLITQLGLRELHMIPEEPIEETVSCSTPVVTPGLFENLSAGAIKPIQGTFDRYEGKNIVMTTGDTVTADVAILAVGWKLGVPFLEETEKAKLIDEDGQYRVYRLSVNPDLPDMGFVGFNSSFCSVLSAEMVANWLVRYMDGQLENQPSESAMREDIDMTLAWKRTQRRAAKVYGGLCSAPFHFKHFDELLADMGASKLSHANPLSENFSYPDYKTYRECLASTPQYHAE